MRVKNVNGISYDSNAYLIDAKRITIVDAGMNGQRVLGNIPGGLELIILTHCHYDHIGAVPEIVKATGARVAMHEKDVPLLRADRNGAAAIFNARQPKFTVDMVLKDDEVIDIGDASLRVLHTPGHTPGSICLYNPESRELFTGDTVFEGGSFGRTDLGGSPEAMVRSLEMLTKLDVSVMYPGHGGIVTENVKRSLLASYNNARHMLF